MKIIKKDFKFILFIMALIVLFSFSSISSVSATTYNATDHDDNAIIQDAISFEATDGVIEFQEGTYENLGSLTIDRSNLIIKGTGQVNIIGSESDALFTIKSGIINITIQDLNITGYGVGIMSEGVMSASIYANIDKLSIFRCNISAVQACVWLDGSSFTDIVIENNTMVCQVYAYPGAICIMTNRVTSSVISTTIKGNNITVRGSLQPIGLFFYIGTGCISTLIIEDNNIDASRAGITIDGFSYITNNISLKNNTVKSSADGVVILLRNGNNIINIIDNRINTTYNQVSWAVLLTVAVNDDITFSGNNITSEFSGLQIRYGGGSLYLYDNNFITKEVAVYLAYSASLPISAIDVLMTGNTIISEKVAFMIRTYNLTTDIFTSNFNVNFNQIISPIGLCVFYVGNSSNPYGTIVFGDYASSSFDYNWWGANDISNKIIGFKTNNHYILNITPLDTLKDLEEGDTVRFALLVLNDGSIDDGVKNLPLFSIEGTFDDEPFSTNRDNSFVYETPKLTEGKHLIKTSISSLNPSNFSVGIIPTKGEYEYNGVFQLSIDELSFEYPFNVNEKGVPELKTNAVDKVTGSKNAVSNGTVTIVDTVTYTNLVVGRTYTINGVLIDKSTGNPLIVNGAELRASKTFVANSVNGSVELEFTFDASNLGAKTIVVFEKLFYNGVEIASHEDINDVNQTVVFKEVDKDINGNRGEYRENITNNGNTTENSESDENPESNDLDTDDDADSNNEPESNDKPDSTLKTNASMMKSTGIPIVILLILTLLSLIVYQRKIE